MISRSYVSKRKKKQQQKNTERKREIFILTSVSNKQQ